MFNITFSVINDILFNMPFFLITRKSHLSVADDGFQAIRLFVVSGVAFDGGVCGIPFLKLWSKPNFKSCRAQVDQSIWVGAFISLSFFLWIDLDGIVVWISGF